MQLWSGTNIQLPIEHQLLSFRHVACRSVFTFKKHLRDTPGIICTLKTRSCTPDYKYDIPKGFLDQLFAVSIVQYSTLQLSVFPTFGPPASPQLLTPQLLYSYFNVSAGFINAALIAW